MSVSTAGPVAGSKVAENVRVPPALGQPSSARVRPVTVASNSAPAVTSGPKASKASASNMDWTAAVSRSSSAPTRPPDAVAFAGRSFANMELTKKRRSPDGFGDFVGLGCHADAHRRDVLNERDDRRVGCPEDFGQWVIDNIH